MEFLSAHLHAVEILTLIGVTNAADNYEIRTEWTHGGKRRTAEVQGKDNPTVLRLWNTGAHYEPIAIAPAAPESDLDDLGSHQTNAKLTRPSKPGWMTTLEQALGEPVATMSEVKVNDKALEGAGVASHESKRAAATGLTTISAALPGWKISQRTARGAKQATRTFTFHDPDPAEPFVPPDIANIRRALEDRGVTKEQSSSILVKIEIVRKLEAGKGHYVYIPKTQKWKRVPSTSS